ncbi:MAG: hypothetical protein AB7L28_21860, partial [Kofleriaceae bacterium]
MLGRAQLLGIVAAALASAPAVGCSDRTVDEASPGIKPHQRELSELRQLEEERRAATDFATLPASDVVLGADPYRIVRVARDRFAGLLRAESAIVLLDGSGAELARAAAPRSPSGLAVTAAGDVLVVGEGAREIAQFRVRGASLERVATLPIDALGMRDIAVTADARTAYIVEELDGRLLEISLARGGVLASSGVRELGRCHGPIQVETAGDRLVVNCLLDRTLEIRSRTSPDRAAVVRIQHDGPMWGFAIEPSVDGLLVAAGGVEDHPLERRDGGFGYIDSFIYLYRVPAGAREAERLAAINASARGVVTPKWLAIRTRGDTIGVTTAGYGSAGAVTLRWRDSFAEPAALSRSELPPGTAAAA